MFVINCGVRMKKHSVFIFGVALTVVGSPVFAKTVPALNGAIANDSQIELISNSLVSLDSKEAYGIKLANEWKKHPDKPRRGEDGSVKYLFGATLPSLICTPLQTCSIELQAGEKINDLHVGDTVRWRVKPALMGVGPDATPILIVKPNDAGLVTNMTITTDRRLYTIKLASTQKEWMPVLSFDYPDDIQQALDALKRRQDKQEFNTVMPTGQNLANLDFGFSITGDNPRWRPVRVYSDGSKTYIQFPSSNFGEAPALVAKAIDGSDKLVNYRVIGDRYVVDSVIENASLIVGVGKNQTEVKIKKTGR